MKSILTAIALVLALSGCATLERVGTLDNYKLAATADVVTTAVGLGTGMMTEANPLTRALAIEAFGHVGGTVVPVIALSIAGYYLLRWINNPTVTGVAVVLTGAAAINNAGIVAGVIK